MKHMRYPGGKGKCFQHLINMMPPHETYIETHLGGGSVMRHKLPAANSIGIDKDARVISKWREQYPGTCILIHGDAADYLNQHQYSGNELIYSDPPYLPSTRRRKRVYAHEYTTGDHEQFLKQLKTLPCMVMISGYESTLYGDLLSGWRKQSFLSKTHTDLRQEFVWMNFNSPTNLHDTRYLGKNFRERQTIKRRQMRIQEKIQQMNPIERNELISWLSATYGDNFLINNDLEGLANNGMQGSHL